MKTLPTEDLHSMLKNLFEANSRIRGLVRFIPSDMRYVKPEFPDWED